MPTGAPHSQSVESAAGVVSLADVVDILSRAKWLIVAGALVAGAFAFYASVRVKPMYVARALLENREIAIKQPPPGAPLFDSAAPGIPARVAMPAPGSALHAPLDVGALESLLKEASFLNRLAQRIGSEDRDRGLPLTDLAARISVTPLPSSRLIAVEARMPTPELAVLTADAVAESVIVEDGGTVRHDLQLVVQQMEERLEVLRRAIAALPQGGVPPDLDDTIGTRALLKLWFVEVAAQTQQARAQQSTPYERIRIVQRAAVSEQPPAVPGVRNVTVGFVAGALLAAIAALATHYWSVSTNRRVR